jgi:cytochrome P450
MSQAALKQALLQNREEIDWWSIITNPAFIEYPYPALKQLQQLGPVHYDKKSGVYFVLGYHEFSRMMKSPEMVRDTRHWKQGWYNSEYKQRDPVGYALFSGTQPQMINCDGKDHARMRSVYTPAFRTRMMTNLNVMIQAEAMLLIEQLPTDRPINFISEFAAPLPLRVMCNMFDIPKSMDKEIGRWSAAVIRMADVMMTDEQKQEAQDGQLHFKAYLKEQIIIRRQNPSDSLMDMAIRALDDGTMTEDETLTNLLSMLIAGHETTVSLISSGLFLLLKNPEAMLKLRSNRRYMKTAIEEFMRIEPGGNMILRVAKSDYDVAGTTIPAGELVMGLIGATNRDPLKFPNPDDFDITRSPNAQLTFGGGPHICIGASLARLEVDIAFSALLDNFSKIELAGTPEWRLDRINARGLKNLPIRLERKL